MVGTSSHASSRAHSFIAILHTIPVVFTPWWLCLLHFCIHQNRQSASTNAIRCFRRGGAKYNMEKRAVAECNDPRQKVERPTETRSWATGSCFRIEFVRHSSPQCLRLQLQLQLTPAQTPQKWWRELYFLAVDAANNKCTQGHELCRILLHNHRSEWGDWVVFYNIEDAMHL